MRTALPLLPPLLLARRPPPDPRRPRPSRRRCWTGVDRIALPGVPGTVTVFGPHAFPVVTAQVGGRPAPIVGATSHGKGRAVLFGHGYFGSALAVGDTAHLVANVLRWAAGDGEDPARRRPREDGARATHLGEQGFQFVDLDGARWTKRLGQVDVVVLPLAQRRARTS